MSDKKIRIHLYLLAILVSFLGCMDYQLFQSMSAAIYSIIFVTIIVELIVIRNCITNELPLILLAALYFIGLTLLKGGITIGLRYSLIFLSIYMFELVHFSEKYWKFGIYVGILFFIRYFFNAEEYLNEFLKQKGFYGGVNFVNVINVNIPCFMVFICLILTLLYIKAKKTRGEKIIALVPTCLSALLSYKLECDVTILTSIIVYVLFELIPTSIFYDRKKTLWVVTGLFIVGCLFPFVTVAYYYQFSGVFSGREVIWANYFSIIRNNPTAVLFGLGASYRNMISDTGLTMHNSFLEMAFSFGFVGVAIYWLVAFRTIKRAFDDGINDTKIYLILAYFSMLIFGYVNTAFQRGYLLIFYAMFLGLCANTRIEEYPSNENQKLNQRF